MTDTNLTPREKLVVAATLRKLADLDSQVCPTKWSIEYRRSAAALEAEAAAEIQPPSAITEADITWATKAAAESGILPAAGTVQKPSTAAEPSCFDPQDYPQHAPVAVRPPSDAVCECGHGRCIHGRRCHATCCPCTAYRPKTAETQVIATENRSQVTNVKLTDDPQDRPQDCPLCGWTPKDGGSVVWCANAKCELSPPCFSRSVWNRIHIAPEASQPEPTPQPEANPCAHKWEIHYLASGVSASQVCRLCKEQRTIPYQQWVSETNANSQPAPPYKNTFVEPKPMEDVLKAAMNQKGSGFSPDHSLQFVSAHNEAHDAGGWSEVEGQWRNLVAISKGDDRATPTIYIRDIRAALAELGRRQLSIHGWEYTAEALRSDLKAAEKRAEKAEARAAGLASDLDDAAKAIARAQEMAK